ncbi:MAG: polysaccharide biosynthesis tyrosine autokinase [Armatimonadetes bacterium]|nr:polysaccharide biosynthesis tyrosine autokinase [Armatimonadota bacterium]
MNRDQMLNLSVTDLSFKELIALFKRRKVSIWVTLVLFIAAGLAISFIMPKTWMSQNAVVLEGKTQSNSSQPLDIVGQISSTAIDYDVPTQIQIISSFRTLYTALRRINYPLKAELTADDVEKLPKVQVQQIQTTNTVLISIEHTDPNVPRELATAIPDVYQEQILETKKDQTKRSFDFVTARLDEERQNFQNQQQEIAQFKQEKNVADYKTETEIRSLALSEAQRKVAEAEADLQGSVAALEQAKQTWESAPKTVENKTSTVRFASVDRAKDQLDALYGQREALLITNLPDSERVKRIDALIKSQEEALKRLENGEQLSTSANIRNPLLDEYERQYNMTKAGNFAAQSRLGAMKAVLEERKTQLREMSEIGAKQIALETRLGEIQQTITRLLTLQGEIKLRENALQSPVTQLTGPTPAKFVRPVTLLNVALAILCGLFVGAVIALVRDVTLDRVNTSNEACSIAEKEVLGRIPVRAASRDPLIADPTRARAFEAYRILRNSVILASGSSKSFMVTSTVQREGKSTIAANLAVAMALEGKRTVIVDGNLRKPSVHKLFKVAREKGLAEVLAGSMTLDEALKASETPNLAVLTAGAEAPNPTELVASDAMKDVITRLEANADFIIIDAPSAFGFADAQSLVQAVKNVLYVTELESPSKQQMREAVGMIDFAGGSILGVILNKDRLASTRTRGSN